MVAQVIRKMATGGAPMVALFVLLLLSLWVLGNTAENLERFGQLYVWLLGLNALGLIFIAVLIGVNTWNLIVQFRRRAAGSRLTARLVIMFVILALVPVTIVYSFSVKFLQSGIDSWFDVQVEQALENALDLSRDSLGVRMRILQRTTQQMTGRLADLTPEVAVLTLTDLRDESGADELTLLTITGEVVASSSVDAADVVPDRPGEDILAQVGDGEPYVGLDPAKDRGFQVRVVTTVLSADPAAGNRLLQALYPVPDRVSGLAAAVQEEFQTYQQLVFLRQPLKVSFILTLSLVLLLSVLTAVWVAFHLARRLMSPIHDLAEGTRAVADGNYSTRLPASGRDELGFLVRSFNEMTSRLATARDEARLSQLLVENQRAYLEAVLGRISTGVITLDLQGELRTVNQAAIAILGVQLHDNIGQSLSDAARYRPELKSLAQAIMPHMQVGTTDWQEEVELFTVDGRKMLVCRGAMLPSGEEGSQEGYVVVFDDVTALIQAQRDAAWSEVARRLAHEIKNPLTPIQLSAERLRQKYLDRMAPEDASVLDRSTHTIVQQVEAMKSMVKAFADYANAPEIALQELDLNEIVTNVGDLYSAAELDLTLELDPDLPRIRGDANRIRQVLHNVITNALEAQSEAPEQYIRIRTRHVAGTGSDHVELSVADEGPGIDQQLLERIYEPYVTSKTKGGGLGLAIVKKIVEEHGGMVRAQNRKQHGAEITIQFPLPNNAGNGRGWSSGVRKIIGEFVSKQ